MKEYKGHCIKCQVDLSSFRPLEDDPICLSCFCRIEEEKKKEKYKDELFDKKVMNAPGDHVDLMMTMMSAISDRLCSIEETIENIDNRLWDLERKLDLDE